MTNVQPASCGASPDWSTREQELLAVTLQLLQETGYDRLTVDEVAARARASKATVYRRWPSKADLVLAAFTEGVHQVAVPPDTGTLRGDLLALAHVIAEQAGKHGGTIRGVLAEFARNPRLRDAMEREFISQRKDLIQGVLRQAAARGEISPDVISDEVWDILPGYLIFRSLVPGRRPTEQTLVALVDEVLLPSLTRTAPVPPGPPRPRRSTRPAIAGTRGRRASS